MRLAANPALIVVDMQNGCIDDRGFYAKVGLDRSAGIAAIEPIRRLLEAARGAPIPVIFTRYCLAADHSDAGLLVELFPAIRGSGGMVRGTWDAEIVDALRPREGELVIDKTRYSAFFGTDLEERLRALGVDQLIVCGVTTNVCVEATGRDAFARDIRVIVVSDATGATSAEMHEAALVSVAYGMGDVATVAEVEAALAA
jgi:ureidoacrylate peracid hydrolase